MHLFIMLYHVVSLAVCTFASRSDADWYVVVGTAKDLCLSPRSCSGGSLILFKFSADATKLEHVHTVRSHHGDACLVALTGSSITKCRYYTLLWCRLLLMTYPWP